MMALACPCVCHCDVPVLLPLEDGHPRKQSGCRKAQTDPTRSSIGSTDSAIIITYGFLDTALVHLA